MVGKFVCWSEFVLTVCRARTAEAVVCWHGDATGASQVLPDLAEDRVRGGLENTGDSRAFSTGHADCKGLRLQWLLWRQRCSCSQTPRDCQHQVASRQTWDWRVLSYCKYCCITLNQLRKQLKHLLFIRELFTCFGSLGWHI